MEQEYEHCVRTRRKWCLVPGAEGLQRQWYACWASLGTTAERNGESNSASVMYSSKGAQWLGLKLGDLFDTFFFL